ncbi:MAG: hypothetical protein O2829_01700 [Bacteroidetes bacterium]|nr:hypothetical protein [Bacteroidota bacterium]MDA1267793.1 hypothetical protein [Bacteroidota bacterium]
MLEGLHLLFLGLALCAAALLTIGLVRPVLVLWFMARFNRLKVIQFYGTVTLIFLGLSFVCQIIG